MPWPLLKWIMYTSSSSSSSSEDFDEEEEEGINKKENEHRRESNKQGEQNNDEDSDDDDFSYEPQEEETSNSSDYTFTIDEPRRKRRRIDNKEFSPNVTSFKRRKRVWSKEDELELLKNFLDYRTRPRTANEAPSFYDEVNPKFKEQYTKRKLAEKLGRLKKKYRNVVKKMMNNNGTEFRFRNPHDSAIFDISHRIWAESPLYNIQEKNVVVDSHDVGSSKTSFDGKHGDDEGNTDVRGMIIGLAMNPIPLSLSNYGCRGGDVADEKWREQQILELEAYSKRLELVQQQVKAALDDLRSK
uniref:uncharacterized protein LOC105352569 n=1 Tax=Fragaria vesca subsp. vesca TaxID=101020 RepID=UPI0005CB73B3|nr:PREDICTED: uncharacterized protein LOC105352569 [Fragaria vesca subsp. vesca]